MGNKLVDHSDAVETSPVGAAPTAPLSFIFDFAPGFNGLDKDNCKTRLESFMFCDLVSYIRDFTVIIVFIDGNQFNSYVSDDTLLQLFISPLWVELNVDKIFRTI